MKWVVPPSHLVNFLEEMEVHCSRSVYIDDVGKFVITKLEDKIDG